MSMINFNTICPMCGDKLLFRNGKYGGFIGCSNFPKCDYAESLDKNKPIKRLEDSIITNLNGTQISARPNLNQVIDKVNELVEFANELRYNYDVNEVIKNLMEGMKTLVEGVTVDVSEDERG